MLCAVAEITTTLPEPRATAELPPHWTEPQRDRALQCWILRTSASAFVAQGFVIYYLRELGANDGFLGLATSLPSLAIAAQFIGSLWAERTASRQRLTTWLFALHGLTWLPALLVGVWAAGRPERYAIARVVFLLALTMIAFFFHLHSPAWDSWFTDAVEHQHKSRFFGRWALWTGILTAAATVLSGWLIESVAGSHSSRLFQWMLLAIFATGMAGTIAAALSYRALPDTAFYPERQPLVELIRVALGQRNYMLFMSLFAFHILAQGVYAVFVIAWFKDDLRMTVLFLSVMTALNQISVAVASPLWSRLLTRFGAKPVLGFGLVCVTLHVLIYFFYTPTNYHWVALMHWGLTGMLAAAFTVSANTLWYGLPSREARSMQFAIAWTTFGVTGAVGAAMGGWIASHSAPLVIGHYQWSKYHWLLLLSLLLHVPCFILLQKLKPEDAQPPWIMVTWLMRRVTGRRIG